MYLACALAPPILSLVEPKEKFEHFIFLEFPIQLMINKFSSFLIFRLTEADVFLFGHLQAIIECPFEDNILSKVLAQFPRLQKFCLNFNQLHLGQQAMLFS